MRETKIYLFTHFHFDIGYNGNRVRGRRGRCLSTRHISLPAAPAHSRIFPEGAQCVLQQVRAARAEFPGDRGTACTLHASARACTHAHTHTLPPPTHSARTHTLTHTHKPLTPQVIELNVSTVSVDPNKTVDITRAESLDARFSYSVKWHATNTSFDDRMDRFSRYSFLPQHLEVGAPGLHEGFGATAGRGGRGRQGPGRGTLTARTRRSPRHQSPLLSPSSHTLPSPLSPRRYSPTPTLLDPASHSPDPTPHMSPPPRSTGSPLSTRASRCCYSRAS